MRVQAIDADYEAAMDAIDAKYATSYDNITKLRRGLITVDAKNKTVPEHSVLEDSNLLTIGRDCLRRADAIKELRSLGSSTTAAEIDFKSCLERWNNLHIQLLVTTYWAADLDWILKALGEQSQGTQIESLFVYSHNIRLKAYIEKRLTALNAARMIARRELDDARAQSVQHARELRDAEIAEKQRRFALAMSAMAQAMSNAHQPSRPSVAVPSTSGCSSDFDCGIGSRCVKANYSLKGYCAKAVNEFGVQTFDMPDMNSVLVKVPQGSDCHFVTDCPIGFRCDVQSGACLR
jgi:aryl carrier-like protein